MGSGAKIWLLTLAIVLLPVTVWGEEITFTASVDRVTISRTDRITYTLTIEGVRDGKPVLPDIPGFEVIGSSSGTQFSLVNNRTQVSQSISYSLMPVKSGEFTIPAARLVYGGKTYLTRPIKVRVTDGPVPAGSVAPSAAARPAGPADGPGRTSESDSRDAAALFIATEVDRKEAYVNEQVTLTFKLFRRLQIANLNYTPPPTTGFIEESLGEEKNYGQVREGFRYEVLELQRAVFPISAGELTIGPAELKGDILVPRQRQRAGPFGFDDFFADDFFGRAFAEPQPFLLRSDPISLTVKSLPRPGRPENFRGAVGRFDLQASAAPAAVRVGEPVTVTMKISGIGNLDNITLPEIPAGDRFQSYAPEVETKKTVTGGRMGGEKIFKQVFIPLTEEADRIPAVSFSFFDPEKEEYRTLTAAPIPIKVSPAPDRETLRLVEDARSRPGAGEEIRILGRDILYIKGAPGRLRPRGEAYYLRPVFWAAVILLPGILLTVRTFTARRERLREDLVYARQVGASRSARKKFKEARRLLAAGEGERFYGEVHRAFNRYLGDKFRIPAGAVSSGLIAEKLAAAGAEEEIGRAVEECLATFDRARFSGAAGGTTEMREFLSRAENLVGRLEKIKIK